eukprot:8831408-Ditylum_brightwellii.AAC.1
MEDYSFYVGSPKQASDFNIAYKYVVNHIKKTFDQGNDIAEELRNFEEPDQSLWEPRLEVSCWS